MDNKKVVLMLLLLCTFSPVIAQDMNLLCGTNHVRYNNGNKTYFEMIVHCPYKEYKDDTHIPKSVKALNKKYLLSRVGKAFLNKIRMEACYVIDFSNKELIKHPDWIEHADKRVKYAFEYSFNVQVGMKYYFTTVYDSVGNIISHDQVPDYRSNASFSKFISVCKAIDVAESDTVFTKPIYQVSMEYLDTANAFVWELEMNPLRGKNNLTLEDRHIIVNANTGAIIEHRTQEVISVQNRSLENEKDN